MCEILELRHEEMMKNEISFFMDEEGKEPAAKLRQK